MTTYLHYYSMNLSLTRDACGSHSVRGVCSSLTSPSCSSAVDPRKSMTILLSWSYCCTNQNLSCCSRASVRICVFRWISVCWAVAVVTAAFHRHIQPFHTHHPTAGQREDRRRPWAGENVVLLSLGGWRHLPARLQPVHFLPKDIRFVESSANFERLWCVFLLIFHSCRRL